MTYRRTPFVAGEWFHCYTRTIDHSRPFDTIDHSQRFLETLYLANQDTEMPVMPQLHREYSHGEIFSLKRTVPLVMIGAYCIMPTHYHLLLQPAIDDGITRFMRKLGTGFTRYLNEQEFRIGNLFVKPFRSRHVADDRYFQHFIQYIHLNPLELTESHWKEGEMSPQGQPSPLYASIKEVVYQNMKVPYARKHRYSINQQSTLREVFSQSLNRLWKKLGFITKN